MNDNLKDAVMKSVLANEQHRKAWKRKEKIILFIYGGAIFFALLFLFLLKRPQAVSLKFVPGSPDLMVYYTMFIITLVFSLIAFGAYFLIQSRPRTYSP